MECIRCKTEMFSAKFCADTVGTGSYITNKKKDILESQKSCSVYQVRRQTIR